MELNAVEQYIHDSCKFASIKVLMKKLKLNKNQVKRFIFHSTHLKPVHPLLLGSGKEYVPVFEYHEYPEQVKYFKRIIKKQKKKMVVVDSEI